MSLQVEDGLGELSPGARIRELRRARGMTQKQLAELVGRIDAAGVSNIERGAAPLGLNRAQRFAEALGVSPSLLLPSDPQPTIRDVLARLEGLEGLVALLVENQERSAALLEHLAERRSGVGESDWSQ